MARLLNNEEGTTGLLCAPHLRLWIETIRFIAVEGPQKEEDIIAQLERYSEAYPWPKQISE